ncbi:MAG: FAD-dependent oxidoreductase [Acidobacteriota bacterium]
MKRPGKIVVLGGGLAGLSTLWHLQKAGHTESVLIEKESRPGGLTRSEVVGSFTFDFTGHLLHFKNEAVARLVTDLLGDNLHYVTRSAWIYSHGVYTRYPFQTNLYGLPSEVIKECIAGFVQASESRRPQGKAGPDQRRIPTEYESFEAWIYAELGSGIARHFMVPYNQKLWATPLNEMTCEWMGRFVPETSLEQVLAGAFTDQRQNIGYNARFAYPLRGGIESLPRAFLRDLRNVHSGCEVCGLDLKSKRIRLANGEDLAFDTLVSTIPLPRLIQLMADAPESVLQAARGLRYTSVYNVNLGVDRRVSDRHWVYFPEPQFIFYRAGFAHNFSPHLAPEGCSSIYAEVGYSERRKPIDKGRIAAQVKTDLVRAGILRDDDTILAECCLDIPCAYVVYDHHYRYNVGVLRSFLREQGVRTIGRYGSWEYSGMEDAIWQGRLTAEGLLRES